MHVSESLRYPAAPERVAAMLADPDFVRSKYAPFLPAGTEAPEVRVDRDGEAFVVYVAAPVPPELVPGTVRSLVPADLTLDVTESWAPGAGGGWRGTLTATMGALPAKVELDQELRAAGDGTERTAAGAVTVTIPFHGAKLERTAADNLAQLVVADEQAGRAYLAS